MAPALIGPHYPAECPQCHKNWFIAAETYSTRQPVICPVCGGQDANLGQLKPGKAVKMIPLSPHQATSQLKRLDCIVFKDIDSDPLANAWTCKRIWGLPDEQVLLRNGQLWINGKIFQKDIQQLRQVAIPVSNFPDDAVDHWVLTENTESNRMQRPDRVHLRADQRLVWKYRNPNFQPIGSVDDQPVMDDYWEDHATGRSLLPVNDLLLNIEFELRELAGDGEDGVVPTDRALVACEYWGHTGAVECRFGSTPTHEPDATRTIAMNPRQLSIGGWDGWMWAQWDDQPPVRLGLADLSADWAMDRVAVPPKVTQFSIRILDGDVTICKLRVDRDLYLRDSDRDPQAGLNDPLTVGPNEFYVLGDNLPISFDSRNGLGKVQRSNIVGKLMMQSGPR